MYKDKLIKVNNNNYTYLNNYLISSCDKYNYTWGVNHRLTKLTIKDTNRDIDYNYNAFGMRVCKSSIIAPNVRESTDYIYSGNRLLQEIRKIRYIDNDSNSINPSIEESANVITYIYDETSIIGFKHNDTLYYYQKDVLGNIKYILNADLNIVCKYIYDAWGNHQVYSYNNNQYTQEESSNFIGNINPIRYKGYYYDVETKLFYCNSRYYSPELCRWISPDSIEYLDPESINGLNLYCYCMNNPIMYADPSGHSLIIAMLIGAGIGLVAGLASQVVSDVISNVWVNGFDFSEWQMSSWQSYVGAGFGGAIGGMFTPLFGAVAVGFITGTASTAITMVLSNATEVTNYSLGEIVASSFLIGMVSGLTAGIVDNIKIPELNAGRNSLNAISKQINNKLIRGTINNVREKTLRKMFTLSFLYSAPFTVFNSAFTILNMKG